MDDCILLVGLGNPGTQYSNNRHNVGFRVIDAISDSVSIPLKRLSSIVDACLFSFCGKKIVIAKPLTFMNLSGRAVRFLLDFYKMNTKNVYVFHDDIDLDFSRIKIKKNGGNGGHNGLKSIDSMIGNDYWRIRIGVGRPEYKSMVSSYVLHDFDDDQSRIISKICCEISKNIPMLFEDVKKLEACLNSTYLSTAKIAKDDHV